jgi:hypothetical protein
MRRLSPELLTVIIITIALLVFAAVVLIFTDGGGEQRVVTVTVSQPALERFGPGMCVRPTGLPCR